MTVLKQLQNAIHRKKSAVKSLTAAKSTKRVKALRKTGHKVRSKKRTKKTHSGGKLLKIYQGMDREYGPVNWEDFAAFARMRGKQRGHRAAAVEADLKTVKGSIGKKTKLGRKRRSPAQVAATKRMLAANKAKRARAKKR